MFLSISAEKTRDFLVISGHYFGRIDNFPFFCQFSQHFSPKTLTKLTDFRISVNLVNVNINNRPFHPKMTIIH